ncbi:MAG: STAS domain-containing protein [Eubacteriales bacterium]
MLSVNITESDEKWIIHLHGEIDIYTVDKFKQAIEEKMEKKEKDILVDMENLEYIDSTGLGALIHFRGRYNGISIELINLKPNVKKLFDITGLTKIFIVH